MSRRSRAVLRLAAVTLAIMVSAPAFGAILYSENFEVDTSAELDGQPGSQRSRSRVLLRLLYRGRSGCAERARHARHEAAGEPKQRHFRRHERLAHRPKLRRTVHPRLRSAALLALGLAGWLGIQPRRAR